MLCFLVLCGRNIEGASVIISNLKGQIIENQETDETPHAF